MRPKVAKFNVLLCRCNAFDRHAVNVGHLPSILYHSIYQSQCIYIDRKLQYRIFGMIVFDFVRDDYYSINVNIWTLSAGNYGYVYQSIYVMHYQILDNRLIEYPWSVAAIVGPNTKMVVGVYCSVYIWRRWVAILALKWTYFVDRALAESRWR